MDDLVRWLGEQLDEDAAVVREANTSPEMVTGIPRSYVQAPVALHIARFADPARVLRDIETKRLLIKAWASMLDVGPDIEGGYTKPCRAALAAQAHSFLVVLSLPYADRPGYAEALAAFE